MNTKIKAKLVLKKQVKRFISKFLITTIIFLVGMIFIKSNPTNKKFLQFHIYEENLPFQSIKSTYEKYFGYLLSGDKINQKTEAVFHEKIVYSDLEEYQNGVKLKVDDYSIVPVLESGIIVFMEQVEGKNRVVIEQTDGVDVSYGNVSIVDKKLYDYIEKGEVLGVVHGNELYLTFQKKGEYLDYKNYL